MSIDRKTVEYVAHLARIELKSQELDRLSAQLEGILGFIGKLNKVDIKNIKPTSHILPASNVLRQDSLRESLAVDEALDNAPSREGNFFVVPKVIE